MLNIPDSAKLMDKRYGTKCQAIAKTNCVAAANICDLAKLGKANYNLCKYLNGIWKYPGNAQASFCHSIYDSSLTQYPTVLFFRCLK